MAKQSGLGDHLLVAGYDLSGDVGSLGRVGGGPAALEVTGIDKKAHERVGGVRDGSIEHSCWFNPGTGRLHERLSALPRTDQIVTYCRGFTAGAPAACLVGKQIGYDPTRGADGSLTIAVQALANGYGLEWGVLATPGLASHTGADTEDSVDGGAASTHGLQAYLHVTAFTGTDATIKLQSSSDDGSSDAFADVTGGGFTQITAGPTSERIAVTGNVERYVRIASVTTGGFTELKFAVVIVRNETAVSF